MVNSDSNNNTANCNIDKLIATIKKERKASRRRDRANARKITELTERIKIAEQEIARVLTSLGTTGAKTKPRAVWRRKDHH